MPSKVAPVLRASCAAGLLALCVAAAAAERKSPLIGATKDEVLARFGEPKSQMVAGPREVLFFAKERIVLRDNRVVEVEEIQADVPVPKAAAKPAPATPAPEAGATEPAPADNTPSPPSHRAAPDAAPEKPNEPASAVVVPPPEPEVQIKSVRPPSRTASSAAATPAPSPSASTAVPAASPSAVTAPEPVPAAPTKTRAEPAAEVVRATPSAPVQPVSRDTAPVVAGTPAIAPSPTPPADPSPSPAVPAKSEPQAAPAEPATATPSLAASAEPADHAAPTTAKPAPAAKRVRSGSAHPEVVVPDAADSVFTTTNKLIALAVILIGGGYLVWRRRQRTMLLEATAVSRSPFVAETPVATNTGTKFTPELLQKLEWCRFEELVAAYYNKTGVVASRTKSGPDGAVHIRISWKGEQRPFACVQCVANPAELVGPAQVQALCEVLAAEDIRRGYIVTSGKFSVPARDLAEEKHVTLLPGDIFLDKLNALPEPVRSELIRDATAGDYTTPTCPKCEIKTVRGDGSSWKCVQCGTELSR